MASIVLELQSELVGSEIRLSSSLRKGLLIATKLGLSELEKWLISELEGYNLTNELPEYRKLQGVLYYNNPYIGTRPVGIPDNDLEKTITKKPMAYPISELEKILESQGKDNNANLTSTFPGGMQVKMQKMCGFSADYRFILHLEYYQIEGIVEAVRNTLLKWTLQLEEDGILGDGIVFSTKEKEAAKASIYNTTYVFNAPIQNSQIQSHTQKSTQLMNVETPNYDEMKVVVEQILDKVDELGIGSAKVNEVKADLNTMAAQLKSSAPKMGVLKECWQSTRNILEGTTGSLVASGLMAKIQWLSEVLK